MTVINSAVRSGGSGTSHKGKFWQHFSGQLILVLLVLLVPTLLTQAYFFKQSYESRRQNEFQTNLQVARAVAKAFEAFVKDVVHQEYAIGRAMIMRDMSADEQQRFMDDNMALYPSFLSLLWVGPDGHILASYRHELDDQSLADRKHVREIIDGREWAVSDLILARSTGEPIISIACGIRDEKGRLLGIVIAAILSDKLGEVLAIERSPGGAIALVDSTGRLVFRHPSINLTWEERDWMKDYPRFTEVFAGKEIAESWFAPYQGKRRLIANVPVKPIGWAAGAGCTEEIAMEAITSQLLPQALLFAVISLAAFGSALLCSRFIVKSIRQLRDQAVALGAGERLEPVVAFGSAEVGELARSFNEMAEKLIAREMSLRDQREWFRVTLTSIGDAVIATDESGLVTFINPVAVKLTGWQSEKALGQPVQSVFRIINEKTRQPAENIVERVLREGCIVNLGNHTALVTNDGREIPIEDSAAPIKDGDGNLIGVILVFHDVMEKRRAEAALRESEITFRTLYESMAEGVALHKIIYDENGNAIDYRIISANPAYEKHTGLKTEQVEGKLATEAYGTAEAPYIEEFGQVAQSGNPYSFETYFPSMQRHFHISVSSPGKDRFVTVFEDITERKHAEERLQKENREVGLVNRILRVFAETSGDELFDQVLEIVQEGFASRHGVFGYVAEPGHLFCPSLSKMLDECEIEGKCIHYPPEKWKGLWARSLLEKRSFYVNKPPPVPAGHPVIRNNLAAPILFRSEVIGLLNLANKESDYTESDRALLEAMAERIAPLLYAWIQKKLREDERARAEDALRKAHDELELRVKERTAELETVNEKLAVEIEERRKALEIVKAERQCFFDVLETLPVYVCLLKPDYHVSFVNRVFRESFGEAEEGLRCFEFLFGRNEPCEICETYRVLEDMAPRQWEWTGPNHRIYSVFDFPFTDTDGSTLILEMGIDITERKQAEAELRAYTARLELVNQELQEFAFIASHDLQEPLRKIQAFGQMLRTRCEAQLNEQGKDCLVRMENAATRMRQLIQDLLQFSRVATRPELYKPVILKETLTEIMQVFEDRLAKEGVTIEISDLPVIDADASQMRQLFQNLIGNALKYRKENEPPKVRIYSRNSSDGCEIFVEDNGIGFEQEYADKIFAPFQRLHTKGNYEGTGMGLAICRKIVERHGGSITARSNPGYGSTFIISLPVRQSR